MSRILIKGAEMPKYCGECFIGDRLLCRNGCPLVEVPEPHGRLIDAEELCKRIGQIYDLAYKQKRDEVLEVLENIIIPMVVSAPTVIEGDRLKELAECDAPTVIEAEEG